MKSLMAILVLVVAVPAMATVTFTATGTDDGSGKFTIAYSTSDGDRPRGVALQISCSDGATADVAATETAASWDTAFNTFIDWAYSNPLDFGFTPDKKIGHPLALRTEPGALGNLSAVSEFSVCMGVLDNAGAQAAGPESTTNLVTIVLKKGTADQTTVTITADTLRGPASGVVGSVLNSNLTTAPVTCVVKFGGVVPCVKETASFFADWKAFGEPPCWCYARNCKGDANGDRQGSNLLGWVYVFSDDLNILISGWGIKEAPKGPGIMSVANAICADFARDQQGSNLLGWQRVFSNDLNILIANWNIKEAPKGPGVADCGTADYNFFVNP